MNKTADGVQAPFYEFDSYENMSKLRNIFRQGIGGASGFEPVEDYSWFRKDDPYTSARNLLILLIAQDLVVNCGWEKEARHLRDFLRAVVAEQPFPTKHKGILGMVAVAVQQTRESWEIRNKLIARFVIDTSNDR